MGTVQGQVTNNDGRTLSFSYDPSRLWLSITDTDGSALSFELSPISQALCQNILNQIRAGMQQHYPGVA